MPVPFRAPRINKAIKAIGIFWGIIITIMYLPFRERIQVEQTGESSWKGKHCLGKPGPGTIGTYGGWIIGQALLVSIRSCESGFTPHSLHSYFLRPGSDQVPFCWEVDSITNGRNYCNRVVKGYQDGKLKYMANVSLTLRNSTKADQAKYEEYLKKKESTKKQNGSPKGGDADADADDDDDDDDDVDEVAKPFSFAKPYPEMLRGISPEQLPTIETINSRPIVHKLPPKMLDLLLSRDEESIPVADRRLAFFVKCEEDSFGDQLEELRAPAIAYLSDSLFLTRLARVLRIEVDQTNVIHYKSVSLDHSIYFHDTDYDPTQFLSFSFNAIRMGLDRVLLEGEIYNSNGEQVVSVIQEGLVKFGGLEKRAKL